jgi:hypothetical protein
MPNRDSNAAQEVPVVPGCSPTLWYRKPSLREFKVASFVPLPGLEPMQLPSDEGVASVPSPFACLPYSAAIRPHGPQGPACTPLN